MRKLYTATLAAALASGALIMAFNGNHQHAKPATPDMSDCFTADTVPQKQFGISENPAATAGQAYLYHARATRAADGSMIISNDEVRYATKGGADTKVTKTIAFSEGGVASVTRSVEEQQLDGSWKNNPAYSEKGSLATVFQRDAGKDADTLSAYTFKEYLQPAELVLGCRLPKPKA
ncbi:MAG: hypothetical protein PW788_03035 [Micavibrio sp.]|nr:hypothetical protein [Micavibrio sp.]